MKLNPIPLLLVLVAAMSGVMAVSSSASIDLPPAHRYFDELREASDKDAGALWGKPLYGPTLFVDPNDRTVVSNQADSDGLLKPVDSVYTGSLPSDVNISNTATAWSGVHWAMIGWNAVNQNDPYDRLRLLVHENWHRIEEGLGIPMVTSANAHLDATEGRILMLLEFRALAQALAATDSREQTQAISDALTLRAWRQSQFSRNNEDRFERHEGAAEYTGLKLCGLPDSLLVLLLRRKLASAEQAEGLANSFAYFTGPACGLLLDRSDRDWRPALCTGATFSSELKAWTGWTAPADKSALEDAANSIGAKYGIEQLQADAAAQAEAAERTATEFGQRLNRFGRLVIPNDNLRFVFNPQEKLVPFDTLGVIYHTLRLTGEFGVLEVTDGILRANNWTYFMVAVPSDTTQSPMVGEAYTLELNDGWHIVKSGEGAFTLARE